MLFSSFDLLLVGNVNYHYKVVLYIFIYNYIFDVKKKSAASFNAHWLPLRLDKACNGEKREDIGKNHIANAVILSETDISIIDNQTCNSDA